MKRNPLILIVMALFASACISTINAAGQRYIADQTISATLAGMVKKYGSNDLMERGIRQAAAFWTAQDGSEADFTRFCLDNFASTPS